MLATCIQDEGAWDFDLERKCFVCLEAGSWNFCVGRGRLGLLCEKGCLARSYGKDVLRDFAGEGCFGTFISQGVFGTSISEKGTLGTTFWEGAACHFYLGKVCLGLGREGGA